MRSRKGDKNTTPGHKRRTLRSRGAARNVLFRVVAASSLLAVALVIWLNYADVPPGGNARAHLLLVLVTAAAASFGMVWPLLRLLRQRAARQTFTSHHGDPKALGEQEGDRTPEMLASRMLPVVRNPSSGVSAPTWLLLGMSMVGALMLVALLWMILAAPDLLRL